MQASTISMENGILKLETIDTKSMFMFVHAGNETIGLNLTWAHNLFIGWALGFPTLGSSRHRNSK